MKTNIDVYMQHENPKKIAFVIQSLGPYKRGNLRVSVSLIKEMNSICIIAFDETNKMDESYSVRFFNMNDEKGASLYVEHLFETQGIIK